MQRDPRYDILFEPVRIGPVTAKNRFFQVPHCNGMGHAMPEAHAAMRAAKAEGGWAVVSTEECEIHPTGDISPYVEARLWDDARHSRARADVREGARARRARGDRAHAQRPDVIEPVLARGRDRAVASAAEVRLSAAGARDDVARHPRLSPLASRRGAAREARGLRHRLRLRRARPVARDALPAAASQSSQRRVRRLAREPRAPAARADRRHEGRRRRQVRGCACASRRRNSSASRACTRARRARSCTCSPICRTCGTSTSPPGTWTRRLRASPTRATRSRSRAG